MPSFKTLLKHSWHFYKANWKKLVFVFLPVEVAILASVLILKLGFTPARFPVIAILALIFALLIPLLKIFKLALVAASGQIVSDIEKGEQKVENVYKKVASNIWPMIQIAFLQAMFILAVMFLAFLALIIVFTLPFIALAFLGRIFPAILSFIAANGATLTITMFALCSVIFATVVALCLSSIWFAFNVFLLEGRKGLDALAVSASLSRGKRWSVSWRLVLICIIGATLFLTILGPIWWIILEEAKPQVLIGLMLYKQYGQFGLAPNFFPEISSHLFVWRTLFTFIGCLVAVPIFTTLNFFLWQDVKASAPVFKEKEYTKTRKRIRNTIWTGLVLAMLCVATAMLTR